MRVGQVAPLMVILGCGLSAWAEDDPFQAPPEMTPWLLNVTRIHPGQVAKLQAILKKVFDSVDKGGLGITYDNQRTRTVAEVWRDRKANCLSMTAFYVAACRVLHLDAKFSEAVNTNRWRKVGEVVRLERHVVAVVPNPPLDQLVADFMPTLRRKIGTYVVVVLPEVRFKALYHSNRAVELLADGENEAALQEAQRSVAADPKCSIGWNVLGVVRKSQGDLEAAEQAYRTALSLDGKDGSAIGNLEVLCREQNRLEEAGRLRLLGEQVRKKDPYFNAFLAEEALASGDLNLARKHIALALKILPHESEFYLLEARMKLAEGQTDEALKSIEAARRWADPGERERYDSKMALIKGRKE